MPFVTYPNDYNLTISNLWEDVIAFGVDLNGDGNLSLEEQQIPVFEAVGEV